MAKNVYSLQLLRNTQIFADKETAISGITSAATQDGVIKLARYSEGDETKTIFGIYHDFGGGNAGYTIYDSYQEVIEAIQEKIADLESGSTEAIKEINKKLGSGVTSANTVTDQLEALSGDTASTSADTSVEGAKRYADEKVADAVAGLDYTDTAVSGSYVSKVDEANGVISVTREALPTVAAISEAGKPITAVSESLGAVSATAGTINAEYVNVTGSVFSSSTVQAALEEIETEYKAADAAIVDNASESANTLAKLEDIVNDLSADAKEYSIVKTTTGLPETIKERYSLQDASGNTSGATIDIPKDSHIVSITYDGTTQKLTYTYIDASGNTQSTNVDMSELILETEFASGITVTNHVAHGVVDSTSEGFLTVGADGFKLSGVQDAIDNAVSAATEGLDASVSGGTTAGTATSNHVQVVVDEVDGKLTAVTVSETNIADADDLAALSAKTVTEIASSNNSISATSTAATDGTVSVDLVTDASKIQMSGFTADASGFTAITEDSSVTEAIKAIETAFLANEETVSAALNDLEESKVENIVVNGVTGTFNNKIASVTIDGKDVVLGADYVKPAQASAITTGDTVDEALGKLEAKVDAATSGGITGATVNNAPLAITNNVLTQTVVGKQSEATATSNEAIVVETDANGNLTLGLANLDAGTY